MYVAAHTRPGDERCANEDWVHASPGLVIVLDGLTARTDTGCRHGTAWYVAQLGDALIRECAEPGRTLPVALRVAIENTARRHPECDLTNRGTPAAAVGVLRLGIRSVEALILGDVTIILETSGTLHILEDHRISEVIEAERALSDQYPIGSAEKIAAVLAAKRAELQIRNSPQGYWISAAIPAAAEHARTWTFPRAATIRGAMLSDGVARLVDAFRILTWAELLDLTGSTGPEGVVDRLRAIEASDPAGARWPRNKASDDATVAYFQVG